MPRLCARRPLHFSLLKILLTNSCIFDCACDCRTADPIAAKVRPFIVTADWRPTPLTDRADLRVLVAPKRQQLELFSA